MPKGPPTREFRVRFRTSNFKNARHPRAPLRQRSESASGSDEPPSVGQRRLPPRAARSGRRREHGRAWPPSVRRVVASATPKAEPRSDVARDHQFNLVDGHRKRAGPRAARSSPVSSGTRCNQAAAGTEREIEFFALLATPSFSTLNAGQSPQCSKSERQFA